MTTRAPAVLINQNFRNTASSLQSKENDRDHAIGSILVTTDAIPRSKLPGQLYAGGSTDPGT